MASHSDHAVVHWWAPLHQVWQRWPKTVSEQGMSVGKIPEIFDVKKPGMPPWPSSRDAAALPAHPYEIGFYSKELLEQATRRLSLDRRSAPTDTDVDILIPRPGPVWAVPCFVVVVGQGFHRPWPRLAGKPTQNTSLIVAQLRW